MWTISNKRGDHYKNFTFYNCSSEFSKNVSRPISCLSTRNHTVFASSNSSSRKMFSACDVIASIMVPSISGDHNDEINNDLLLVWDTPDCRECLGQKYADCGFKNTESRELKCFLPLSPEPLSPEPLSPEHGRSKTRKQAIVLGVCIPILVGVVLTICFIAGRRRLYNTSDLDLTGMRPVTPYPRDMEETTGFAIGLDESVIQSYPKTILGESGRLANPEDITCSICLSDYQAKETVKTVPDCKHCFHAVCIEEWLRKNVTCPLCRNPPMSSPLAA